MPAESKLIDKIREYVKSQGGKVVKIHQNGFSELGIPDLLVVCPSKGTTWVETKAPGEVPTPIQLARIKEINDAGGTAAWVDNYEDFKKLLDNIHLIV